MLVEHDLVFTLCMDAHIKCLYDIVKILTYYNTIEKVLQKMKRTLLVYCCCNAAQYRYHAKDAIHIIATVLTRFSYRVHISTSVYVSVLPIHQ